MIPRLLHANCLAVRAQLGAELVDAVITDPPYGLSFMGKEWDRGVPGVRYWEAMLRVAKPGAHLVAFGGTRTHHRLMVAIEDAGWELRDCLMWIYGSGFPKSLDVSKAIDKEAGAVPTDLGPDEYRQNRAKWEGWGTALKPAYEPIILARKPLIGTVAANVLEHGTGGLNIDATRIEYTGEADKASATPQGKATARSGRLAGRAQGGGEREEFTRPEQKGRWPANVIHDGEAGLGEQSRFFYCAKASKSERGEGNTHPTVKPQALMRYLVRLVTPPGGTVLDPFMGSGSTGVAAQALGYDFVGLDISADYVAIAKRRMGLK